jgi:hypothetical protein
MIVSEVGKLQSPGFNKQKNKLFFELNVLALVQINFEKKFREENQV